jgi:hypothetical protein
MSGAGDWVPVRAISGKCGIPRSKGKAVAYIRRIGASTREATGRGGTRIEVFVPDLGADVAVALAKTGAGVGAAEGNPDLWRAYWAKPAKARAAADRRLAAVARYDELIGDGGQAATAAAGAVTAEFGFPRQTISRWYARVQGVPRADWLPTLAPCYVNTARLSEIHADDWQLFRSLHARQGGSTMAEAYRETKKAAARDGRSIPGYDTFRRRYPRKVDPAVDAYLRGGERALDQCFPPQVRDETVFEAYQALNIDGRKADVFVADHGEIFRPIVIALQDIRSKKIVGWGAFRTESSDGVRTVLRSTFEQLGIPEDLYSDNGRFIASKQISGGTQARFRWRAEADEPAGLLQRLGVRLHFTMPYSGRSKPIERGFLDFARNIDTAPEFQGAYCGNRPDAKPEEFAGRAFSMDTFLAVYGAKIADHNAQPGRRTKACGGKLSFDEAFQESYGKRRPVTKLTATQSRYFFLSAKRLKANAKSGSITYNGNTYFAPILRVYRGKTLHLLFDPHNAHGPAAVETPDGRLIAEEVPCIQPRGFNDGAAAREDQRLKRKEKRAIREQAAAQSLLKGNRLRDRLASTPPAQPPAANVIRPFPKKPPQADDAAPAPQPRPSFWSSDHAARLAGNRAASAAGTKG